MQLSRMSIHKMLHRGPMDRLASLNSFSLFSTTTCILLLAQIQIFHALPTSGSSVSFLRNSQVLPSSSGNAGVDPSTFSYGLAYPYRSYRPGAGLEGSYSAYSSYPKDPSTAELSAHPNSVYSKQSTVSTSPSIQEDLEKVLKILEKEIETGGDFNSRTRNGKEISSGSDSVPLPSEKNKPKLAPLVPVTEIETGSHTKTEEISSSSSSSSVEASAVDPLHPPPFAPEFDPEYERRRYGLGSLTLLEQAGPFW